MEEQVDNKEIMQLFETFVNLNGNINDLDAQIDYNRNKELKRIKEYEKKGIDQMRQRIKKNNKVRFCYSLSYEENEVEISTTDEHDLKNDDNPHCHFDWQFDLSSDCSTDFTGYSNCSLSLSTNPSSSSEEFHFEDCHKIDNYDIKPIRDQIIGGTLLKGSSIYRWKNAKSLYAVVSLHGRVKEKHFNSQSDETDNFESPEFNTIIDFPRVKKGDSIFVTIFEKLENGKTVPVCEASKLVKELPEESTIELTLKQPKFSVKPNVLRYYPQLESFGKVSLNLHSKVIFH